MVAIFVIFLINNALWITFSLLLIGVLKNQPLSRMVSQNKAPESAAVDPFEEASNQSLFDVMKARQEEADAMRAARPPRPVPDDENTEVIE